MIRKSILLFVLSTLMTIGVIGYTNQQYEMVSYMLGVEKKLDEYIEKQDNINLKLNTAINKLKHDKLSTKKFIKSLKVLSEEINIELGLLKVENNETLKTRYKDLAKQIADLQKFYSSTSTKLNDIKRILDDKHEIALTEDTFVEKVLRPSVRIGTFINTNNISFANGLKLIGTGSGTIIYSRKTAYGITETLILTCSHLYDGFESRLSHFEVHVFDYNGKFKRYNAYPIYNSNANFGKDIMILKLENTEKIFSEADFISKEDIKNLKIGDRIINVGAGLGIRCYPGFGRITGKYMETRPAFLWQMDAPIIFGNSGGAVFTNDGKMIGITVRISISRGAAVTHMAYFVGPDTIYEWVEKIMMADLLKEEKGELLKK